MPTKCSDPACLCKFGGYDQPLEEFDASWRWFKSVHSMDPQLERSYRQTEILALRHADPESFVGSFFSRIDSEE